MSWNENRSLKCESGSPTNDERRGKRYRYVFTNG
jgi:hypothetical protein